MPTQEQRSYSASLRFELESLESGHKSSGLDTREVSWFCDEKGLMLQVQELRAVTQMFQQSEETRSTSKAQNDYSVMLFVMMACCILKLTIFYSGSRNYPFTNWTNFCQEWEGQLNQVLWKATTESGPSGMNTSTSCYYHVKTQQAW